MDEVNYSWRDRVRDSREAGMAAKEFFVVISEPARDRQTVLDTLATHLEYQRNLEAEGIIVAAGPLSDESGEEWTGTGLIILRADSLEEARKIADGDPMHKQGARTYRLRPWLMNEFSLTIGFSILNRRITVT